MENNNRLISEFMDQLFSDCAISDFKNNPKLPKAIHKRIRYDKDWNLLMKAVLRISKLGYDISFDIEGCLYWCCVFDKEENGYEPIAGQGAYAPSLIDAVYHAVVDFIDWHNARVSV